MAGFRRVSSLAFSFVLSCVLCVIVDVCVISILEDYHYLSFHAEDIRLYNKHLVYSLASFFEMIYFPAFNVSMAVVCCCPILHIISRSAASTSHDVMLSLVSRFE